MDCCDYLTQKNVLHIVGQLMVPYFLQYAARFSKSNCQEDPLDFIMLWVKGTLSYLDYTLVTAKN